MVRDSAVHEEVIRKVIAYAVSISFEVLGLEFSPIKGPEGNIEYLLYLQKLPEGKQNEEIPFSVEDIVKEAHKTLERV